MSCNGVCVIVMSFPVTVCIMNDNPFNKVNYFGFLQVLIIFVVIGIAADDIFVFMDGWKQSG